MRNILMILGLGAALSLGCDPETTNDPDDGGGGEDADLTTETSYIDAIVAAYCAHDADVCGNNTADCESMAGSAFGNTSSCDYDAAAAQICYDAVVGMPASECGMGPPSDCYSVWVCN